MSTKQITLANLDLTTIINFLRGGFTIGNLLRVVAIVAAAFAAPGLTTAVPAAMSSTGVSPDELMTTGTPLLVAIVSFVASTYFKVKPEIVQAVIAWATNKDSEDAGQRVDTACLLVLKTRHGDNDAVMADLAKLAKSISMVNFPDPILAKKA